MSVRVIPPEARDGLVPPNSEGVGGEQAQATETSWTGIVRLEPGGRVEWHHHGDYDTYVYVIAGGLHVEFGPGGRDTVDGAAEDFIVIPKGTVHRETNLSAVQTVLAFVRVGTGQLAFPADGPAA